MATPWDTVDGAKYEAALSRKGRGGLGFVKEDAASFKAASQTEASRALIGNAGAFSAQNYLEKFGWKAGSGLGAKGTGIESYVKPTKKFDNAGIGAALTGALVTNAAFETLFNATARSVNIVVYTSSDESSDSDDEERRARKKRKRDDDKPAPQPIASSSPSPPPERPSTLHPSMRLQFRPSSERLLSDESITAVVEQKEVSLLHVFDPSRSHMYHDRSIGKHARLKAQDSKLAASSSPPSSPSPPASDDSDDSSSTNANETTTNPKDSEESDKMSKAERKRLRKERKEAKRAKVEAAVDDDEAQSKKKKKKKRREEKAASSSDD